MILVCHNSASQIFDDEKGNWLWSPIIKDEDNPPELYPKSDEPFFPYVAVVKWEMTPDNAKILAECKKIMMREYKRAGAI